METVSLVQNVMRGESLAAKNALKTHCKRGHEFTPQNTWLRKTGERHCRECNRLNSKVQDQKRPSGWERQKQYGYAPKDCEETA